MSMPSTSGYRASWRDRAVGSTVNWIINTFATRAYRSFIELHFRYGRERVLQELRAVSDD